MSHLLRGVLLGAIYLPYAAVSLTAEHRCSWHWQAVLPAPLLNHTAEIWHCDFMIVEAQWGTTAAYYHPPSSEEELVNEDSICKETSVACLYIFFQSVSQGMMMHERQGDGHVLMTCVICLNNEITTLGIEEILLRSVFHERATLMYNIKVSRKPLPSNTRCQVAMMQFWLVFHLSHGPSWTTKLH